MKLTVDANVLFSALIKNGISRKLIFHADLELNTPSFFLVELQKYKPMLISKSGLTSEKFEALESILLDQIEIVSEDELLPYVKIASGLVTDEKDLLYVAAALYTDSGILTNDKDLMSQNRIRVYSIEQLAKELKII